MLPMGTKKVGQWGYFLNLSNISRKILGMGIQLGKMLSYGDGLVRDIIQSPQPPPPFCYRGVNISIRFQHALFQALADPGLDGDHLSVSPVLVHHMSPVYCHHANAF